MKTNRFDGIEFDTTAVRETLRSFAGSYRVDAPEDGQRIIDVLATESKGKKDLMHMIAHVVTLGVFAASLSDSEFDILREDFPHKSVPVKNFPFFLHCIKEVYSPFMFERGFFCNKESYETFFHRLKKIHEDLSNDYKMGIVGC